MKDQSVLIVDAHADTRYVIRILLERQGVVEILEAGSVAEGFDVLSICDVALVICEQDLPGPTGMDFLMSIERMGRSPWFFLISHEPALNSSNIHYEKFRFVQKPAFGLLAAEVCKTLEDLKCRPVGSPTNGRRDKG